MPTPTQRLAALFEGNDTHHGTHGEPSRDPSSGSVKWAIRPTAKTLKRGPKPDDWEKHVKGERPLGVVPIRNDNSTSWGSIDYDVYDQDIVAVLQRVEGANLPLVPCRSKSGGLHLFMFTTEPIPARKMQEVLRECAASLGMSDSEIFPKQATLLVDRGDQGSWMIMPYFGGDFGGKLQMQHGLRSNGGDIGLSEFVRIAEKRRQTPAQMDELQVRSTTPKPEPQKRGRKGSAADRGPTSADNNSVPFGDGPPCLVHMTQNGGVPQGGQNTTLFHMAVYFKKKYPDDWVTHLQNAAQNHMSPPYPLSQLDGIIKSHSKREYQYKCKEDPMRSHCDSILCRKKRFGVTGTGGEVMPKITSIKKLNSQPPVWFLDIEDAKVECTTEDLQRWDRMQRILMEKLDNPFGVIPQPVWLQIVQEAMAHQVEVIPVSADAGVEGEFLELLEIYLTNRQRGIKEEDLLLGRPWENEDEGRHYFQLMRLARFLKREGMESMKRPQIAARLHKLEGGHVVKKIKGKSVALHWVPSTLFSSTPSVDPPTVKGKPI